MSLYIYLRRNLQSRHMYANTDVDNKSLCPNEWTNAIAVPVLKPSAEHLLRCSSGS